MNRQTRAYPSYYRRGRLDYAIGYLMYLFVAARMLAPLIRTGIPALLSVLLSLYLLLLIFETALLQRYPRWRDLYFVLVSVFIQALGLTKPYLDVWAMLYATMVAQALYYYSLPVAIAWSLGYTASMFITLFFTSGLLESVALCLTYLAIGTIIISYSIMYHQAEAARRESQKLLINLEQANQKLQDYAAQIEEIATIQERNRLAHELHDSISQAIFSISLNAEAADILIEKDPARLPGLLDQLQEQTGNALAQMRALIQQWRPG